MFAGFRSDIQSVFHRDPAARHTLEIIFCYPGLHAIWAHRFNHWLWKRNLKLLARWLSQLVRGFTGVEIHPGAEIGENLFIDHGMGVIIGETAQIGDRVTLYHGVTLGGTSLSKGKRHPTLEDDVVVGAGAKILGDITVGHHARVGANAVVIRSVPPNSVIVGVPGQIVLRSKPRVSSSLPDLNHAQLPDMIGESLAVLMHRVDRLEDRFNGKEKHEPLIHAPDHGIWKGEDFSI
jgi:serine O-acetyltransferase